MLKRSTLTLACCLIAVWVGRGTVPSPEGGDRSRSVRETPRATPRAPDPIVVDHGCLDLSRIPDHWLERAKSGLRVHYAHGPHGRQITSGMAMLQAQDPRYACAIEVGALPNAPGALCIFDGMLHFDFTPPGQYWAKPEGRHATNLLLQRDPTINVSMWSWCRLHNDHSEAQTEAYLEAISALEQANPGVTFVYMTDDAQSWRGHHEYSSDKVGYQRYLRNERIRAYCRTNGKVLYDFADIESWYDGRQATSSYLGRTFPREHDRFNRLEEAHTTWENCLNKAQAFWWLMARLAGWEG